MTSTTVVFTTFGIYLALASSTFAESSATGEVAQDAELEIYGTVTDANGRPIARAAVEWGSDRERFERRQRVETDEAGKYTMEVKLCKGEWRLAASAAGYSAQLADSLLLSDKHVRNFILDPVPHDSGVVTGKVVDAQGEAIEGVRVEAFTPYVGVHSSFSMPTGRDYFPGPDRVAKTDKEGRFRIEDLPTRQVHLSLHSQHRHVNDTNYPVRKNVRIIMTGSGKPGIVQGRLVDAATGEAPAELGTARIVYRHSPIAYECTHDDGRFTLPIEATLDNPVTIYVYTKRYAAATATLTAVAPGSNEFPKVGLRSGQLVRGKLVDAHTGKPIAGAEVLYGVGTRGRYFAWHDFDRYVDGLHFLEFVQHDNSNRRGGFWFAEPGDGQLGYIAVLADGYQRLFLAPDDRQIDEQTGELMVALHVESVLAGVATDDGKPLANESVSLSDDSTGQFDNMYEHVQTDAAGHFRFGRLGPGKYRITCGPYTRAVAVGAGETVAVHLGEDLGPNHIFGKAFRGITISLYPKFEWEYTQITTTADSMGEYSISGLKPGRYRVAQHHANDGGLIHNASLDINVTKNAERIDLVATPDFDKLEVPQLHIRKAE
jgi:protocatechuate 3,4-dioxygenase beta subunit